MNEDDEYSSLSGKAAGGKARAAKLSPERKAEIARKGAAARWNDRKPITENTIKKNDLNPVLMQKPITEHARKLRQDTANRRAEEVIAAGGWRLRPRPTGPSLPTALHTRNQSPGGAISP